MLRKLIIYILILLSAAISGCQPYNRTNNHTVEQKLLYEFQNEPKIRIGSYPSSTLASEFLNIADLGQHAYQTNLNEKNGIVYTCKAGHIDISHLRKSADWTAYLASKTFKKIIKNKTEYSFKCKEASIYYVKLNYPDNWQNLPQEEKEKIACDASIKLAQYLAYTATTWHEILTWFGYKSTGFYSEAPSAFSWEDSFSNLLGTHLAATALNDSELSYNQAMSLAIFRELKKLELQSRSIAILASEKVRGSWFTGHIPLTIEIKARNLDIGLDDGYVTPWLVPSLDCCRDSKPKPYPAPTLDSISKYGFSTKVEIKPTSWEKDKILNIVYPDKKQRKTRIEPAVHFAAIMDYIKKDADSLGYITEPPQTEKAATPNIYSSK